MLAVALSCDPVGAQDLQMSISGEAIAGAIFSPWIINDRARLPFDNGYAIQAIAGANSSATLSVTRTANAYAAQLTASASLVRAGNSAWVQNDLRFSLRSPTATRVELDMRCQTNYAFDWGRVAITTPTFRWADNGLGGSLSQRVVLDLPANTSVSIDLLGFVAPRQAGVGTLQWDLTFTPIHPCAATAYGTACNTDLTFGTDFTRTGWMWVNMNLNQPPAAGIYIVGTQPTAVPIGPCVLYNDALVVIPAPPSRLYFDAPDISGFQLLLQGALLTSQGQLSATPGYTLNCR